MHRAETTLWTWCLPDVTRAVNMREWKEHGGKWIIFDRRDRLIDLAEKLGPFIDSGAVESAKYWNEDPGAICVYSLDSERADVWKILKKLGAGNRKVWEYDYAMGKNLARPLHFAYSWCSKFSTILQSYGVTGTLRLIREILVPREEEDGK
ncbi:MAG: hypothetical protein P8013_04425 [Candidatus Sulfobium sp.]|jgi:hypothetical protein